MGGRVEGKTKKKSVKAKVTSKFGSKRKLSRMGKKQQKGKAGANAEFITRSAAIRKLQITLKDFRRLCILKGIYPRVPSKAPSGGDKIYYDIKDISYIMHEPLLNKFREFKAFMKKIRRAAGRNQFHDARKKNDLKPKMTMDHLVKERYPRFIDALRDLDDALCMIHLFASLPSVGRITAERTSNCAKLAREWQYYVSKSRSLKKVFVSVKGIYYQAEIMGEPITWLAPHQFTQTLPKEVDYRVMLTFLEFYEVFLKFTLFKLYHMQNWQYPPTVDKILESEGCCLLSMKTDSTLTVNEKAISAASDDVAKKSNLSKAGLTKEKLNPALAAKISSLSAKLEEIEDEDDEDLDDVDVSGPLNIAFSDLQDLSKADDSEAKIFVTSSDPRSLLFNKLVFFINREVPLEWLQFCTTAFGGAVGWDGPQSPIKVDDPRITHHIIDRPMHGNAIQNREYVQPQWVFDSVNAQLLLPCRLYAPGSKLPPHLSPFVNDEREGYIPKFKEEIKKLQQEAGLIPVDEIGNTNLPENLEKDDENEDYITKTREEKRSRGNSKDMHDEHVDSEEENADEGSESDVDSKEQLDDVPNHDKKGPKGVVYQAKPAFETEESELKALSKSIMPKKAKRLYDRMQHGINKKKEAIQNLEAKRKAYEEDATGQNKKAKKTK